MGLAKTATVKPYRPNHTQPLMWVLVLTALTVFMMASCAPRSYPVTPSAVKAEKQQDKKLINQFNGQ